MDHCRHGVPYCPFLSVTPSHFLGVGSSVFPGGQKSLLGVHVSPAVSIVHGTWYMVHGREAQEAGSCQLNEHGLVGGVSLGILPSLFWTLTQADHIISGLSLPICNTRVSTCT